MAFMQAGDVVSEDIDDEMCLLLPNSNAVAVLNSTASDVWLLTAEHSDIFVIVDVLSRAYGVAQEQLTADVVRVVDDLLARGFLVQRS